tara:strand:- start:108 stop:548 length:441 start_codon:yes stop_codon:yes gene_type:complete
MAKYVSFKSNGELYQYGSLKKTLAEIKAIKENDGVTVFSITDNQYEQIQDGWSASVSFGIVTVTEPAGWLLEYKENAKEQEKTKAKKLFENYRNEIDTSDANASTYKTNLNNYFISNVKTPIDPAVDKAGVVAAVNAVDWSSVIVP